MRERGASFRRQDHVTPRHRSDGSCPQPQQKLLRHYHAAAMPLPYLSIVIPAWNQLDYTRACVASLRDRTDVPYQLIIVDNGSEPAAAAAAREMADDFIGNEHNLGFAAAMNQGLSVATGEYVAFVNNDTVFPAAWASQLLDSFAAIPNAGIVMPAVTAAGNQAAVRQEPADRVSVFPPFTAIPSGVVYVTERAAISELGGWSEEYGIASSEDLDLLFTFWVNGRSVVLTERVLVQHASGVTASTLDGRDALYRANRLAFATRWAAATPERSRRLQSCPEADFVANLEKARIAATWMLRWFQAMDQTASAERTARGLELSLARIASEQRQTRPLTLMARIRRKIKALRSSGR
jgi:GT2 family glycosyltransferase